MTPYPVLKGASMDSNGFEFKQDFHEVFFVLKDKSIVNNETCGSRLLMYNKDYEISQNAHAPPPSHFIHSPTTPKTRISLP